MGNIKVSQLPESGQLSNEDLFYIGKKDTSSEGYRPRRVTFGEIKESIKGDSETGIQAFDELWKRSGTPSSGTLTLSGSRTNYTGLVFVFKSDNRYSTIFKTNNEIDLALTGTGTLVLDKLLSGIVPVVGNGNPVGFVGLNSYVPSPEVTLQAALNAGTATGSTAMRQGSLVNSQYSGMGVSTDGNKSNLQTDLSQATGIELTAITNTSVTLSDVTTIDSIYGLTLVGGSGTVGNGSGGVIDGTILHTDTVSGNISVPTGTKYDLYTVQNDCLLYIKNPSGLIHHYYISGNEILYKSANDSVSLLVPVKANTVIQIDESINATTYPFTFIEYKLNSLNPQGAAMPDWNTSKALTISDGDTIQAEGWIVVEYDGVSASDGLAKIKINGAVVSHGNGSANGLSCSTVSIPVSKGDVVTIDASTGHIPVTMTFYPVKFSSANVGAQPASDRTDILNAIYPVGSIFTTIDKTFNPGTAFGGEWEVIGDGRCLFGCNQESNAVGTEIPSALPTLSVSGGTLSLQNHNGTYAAGTGAANGAGTQTGSVSIYGYIQATRRDGTSVTMGEDVKPPSIGVIFWKRTSLA